MKVIVAILLTVAGLIVILIGLVTATPLISILGYIIGSGAAIIIWDIVYESARIRASEYILRTKKFTITRLEHCLLISEADKTAPLKASVTEAQLRTLQDRIFPEPTIVDSTGHVITTLEDNFVDQNGVTWQAGEHGWICSSLV